MILSFNNKEIRSICEDQYIANAKLGKKLAAKLMNRIADLISAESASELITGNPIKIDSETYSISLELGCFLLITSGHVEPKIWNEVKRIKILKITCDE